MLTVHVRPPLRNKISAAASHDIPISRLLGLEAIEVEITTVLRLVQRHEEPATCLKQHLPQVRHRRPSPCQLTIGPTQVSCLPQLVPEEHPQAVLMVHQETFPLQLHVEEAMEAQRRVVVTK